jgi:hypothetical protein
MIVSLADRISARAPDLKELADEVARLAKEISKSAGAERA